MKVKEKFLDSTMTTDAELAGESIAREDADISHQSQINDIVSTFMTKVRDATLSGLSLLTSTPISAADTVLIALGKIQAQILTEVTRATDAENLIVSKLNTRYSIFKTTDESTASTTVYSTYLSLVTPSLPLADYTVNLNWQAATANASRIADFRITIDGVVTYAVLSSAPVANGQHNISKFINLSAISGIKTIAIQYKVSGTSTTLTMLEALISLNRTGF